MTVVSPSTQNLMDSTHPHTVLSKLNEQRCQGLFCDVIVVVEDVKFRAHKNILAACSGYFKKALTTSEKWNGLPTAPFAVNTPPPIFSKTEMEKPSHSGPPSTNDT
uniref:BTB domain-containing protein n=1 Tax=Gouania willdenowi TaxID=441366 RepID=A0A8C5H828_GOUWI